MNVVSLFFDHGFGAELLLFQIDDSVQLAILGCMAEGEFFIEGFLGWRHHGCQSAVDIELVAGQELVESE